MVKRHGPGSDMLTLIVMMLQHSGAASVCVALPCEFTAIAKHIPVVIWLDCPFVCALHAWAAQHIGGSMLVQKTCVPAPTAGNGGSKSGASSELSQPQLTQKLAPATPQVMESRGRHRRERCGDKCSNCDHPMQQLRTLR